MRQQQPRADRDEVARLSVVVGVGNALGIQRERKPAEHRREQVQRRRRIEGGQRQRAARRCDTDQHAQDDVAAIDAIGQPPERILQDERAEHADRHEAPNAIHVHANAGAR